MTGLFVVPTKADLAKPKPTTIKLSDDQRIGMYVLQAKRMKEGKGKPTLTEIVSEALALLFKREKIDKEKIDEISTGSK